LRRETRNKLYFPSIRKTLAQGITHGPHGPFRKGKKILLPRFLFINALRRLDFSKKFLGLIVQIPIPSFVNKGMNPVINLHYRHPVVG
jgi:hypothetical protein